MIAYYNEYDQNAAAWLRELIADGMIAPGDVDERSIKDVQPDDIRNYTQCHFFAGIGGWSIALRLAGWPDDRRVWTGSCPCQPYSAAGKGLGDADERNLWPDFFRLIRECRPERIFGEQVAAATVVGTAGEDADVQEVQDREAVFRVLRQLERQSWQVQGLHERVGAATQAEESGGSSYTLQDMARRQPRPCTCERSQISGEEAGVGVQPRSQRHSKTDRRRTLRTEWDRLRAFGAEGLECTVFGQDRLNKGIHDGECQGRLICSQCHGERMGPQPDFGDCVGDFDSASESFGRSIAANWGAVTSELKRVWPDGISADLEREGYAVGSAVLGAHSVGAPHIRQRLYWVADASSYGHDPCDEQMERTGQVNIANRKAVGCDSRLDRLEYPAGNGRLERRAEPDGRALPADAAMTGWATPTTRDHKDGTAKSCENVPENCLLGRQVHGLTPASSPVETGKSAAYLLNPRFSLWLMGYPVEWASCGARAMQSCRKSPRRSSKP